MHPCRYLDGVSGPFQRLGFADVEIPFSAGSALARRPDSKPVLARVIYPAAEDAPTNTPTSSSAAWMDVHGLSETVRHASADVFGAYSGYVTFILHHLSLVVLPLHRGAPMAVPPASHQGHCADGFPVIVFSHGLFGGREMYTSLCQDLASWGFIVVILQHQDGSSPVVLRPDGSAIVYKQLHKVQEQAGDVAYVHARREQTAFRVDELAEALAFLPELFRGLGDELPASAGSIDPSKVLLVGHSFGGSTVLTAAARHPQLIRGVLVFDPAIDWMPADARVGMMPEVKHGDPPHTASEDPELLHGVSLGLQDVPSLFLYSDSWRQLAWGQPQTARSNVASGLYGKGSSFAFVDGTSHQSPADNMVLLPMWLYQKLGVCSEVPPHVSLQQISSAMRHFALRAVGAPPSLQDESQAALHYETPHLSEVVLPTEW